MHTVSGVFLFGYNPNPMDILNELKQERERINAAIQALSGEAADNGRRGHGVDAGILSRLQALLLPKCDFNQRKQ